MFVNAYQCFRNVSRHHLICCYLSYILTPKILLNVFCNTDLNINAATRRHSIPLYRCHRHSFAVFSIIVCQFEQILRFAACGKVGQLPTVHLRRWSMPKVTPVEPASVQFKWVVSTFRFGNPTFTAFHSHAWKWTMQLVLTNDATISQPCVKVNDKVFYYTTMSYHVIYR